MFSSAKKLEINYNHHQLKPLKVELIVQQKILQKKQAKNIPILVFTV